MKFKFMDRVRFARGFYEGHSGLAIRCDTPHSSSLTYTVRITDYALDIEGVPESDLEAAT